MKRNFVVMAFTVLILGLCCMSCEKENNTAENTSPTLKNLKISDIKVQDGMLCFESWEQYEQTVHALAEACENHVAKYIDSIVEVLGTDDEEAINDQIAKDGFSQFTPLHDFANALYFESMYNLLEQAEIQWMDDVFSELEDNPFNNIDVSRYESALYNEYGDIMIAGEIYHAKCFKINADCPQSGSIKGDSECFFFQEKRRFIHGKLSTTTLSISGATTLYSKKDNGKKTHWYSNVYVHIEGSKGSSCNDFDANSHFHPAGASLPWGCYVSAISMRGTFPTYIVPGNHIHGRYEAEKADKSFDLYM